MANGIQKDLGKVTAYSYAKAAGYTGTEEQFQAIFNEFTENAPGLMDRMDTAVERAEAAVTNIDATIQDAVDDAVEEATASAVATANQAVTDAQAAQAAAEGAVTQANNAVTQANAAVTEAQAAQSAAEDAAESFVLDRTLTDSGAAAPADLVGDLKESVSHIEKSTGNIVETIENISIASFDADNESAVKYLAIDIKPVQEGTGDPSPDNVRPITGWASCNIYHSGEDTSNPTVIPITFPSEAGTVYGGKLEINEDGSGLLTIDRKTKTGFKVSGGGGALGSGYRWDFACPTDDANRGKWSFVKSPKFNKLRGGAPATTLYGRGKGYSSDSYSTALPTADRNEANQFLSDLQLVYFLKNPITYQLTATQITTYLGTNKIWADTGNIDLLQYYVDSKSYIDEQVRPLNEDVFKQYSYSYTGEKFLPKVNGFNSKNILTISYSSGQTLNDIAIYNDYLVCGIRPGRLQIYKLSTKEKLFDIYVTKDGTQQSEHFASLSFSNTFYADGDMLPLLYAEVETEGLYDVIRIQDGTAAIVVKQYQFDAETAGTNPQIAFDFNGGIGYCIARFGTTNKLVKYDLTQETSNEDGTYSFAAISTGNCPYIPVRQGSTYYNGRVYMMTTQSMSSPFGSKVLALDCNGEDAIIVAEMSNLPIASSDEGEGLTIAVSNGIASMYITGYFKIYNLIF